MNKCCICGSENGFTPFGVNKRPNAHCDSCGSLERHRALWNYLKPLLKPGCKILHIAPEWCIYYQLIQENEIDYYPVDINPDNTKMRHIVDVERLPYPDNYFDLIICCDVLNECPNDIRAMSQLYRVLSPR